jgi:hypothetical protein
MYLYLQQPDIETCSTVRNTFEFVRHWTSPVISVSHASLFVGLVLAWTTSSPGKHVKLTTDFNLQTLTRMTISGLNTHTHTALSLSLPGNAGNALWCLSLVLALQHIQVISKWYPSDIQVHPGGQCHRIHSSGGGKQLGPFHFSLHGLRQIPFTVEPKPAAMLARWRPGGNGQLCQGCIWDILILEGRDCTWLWNNVLDMTGNI